MKRQERIERIRGVEREYYAAVAAATLLEERLRMDPAFGVAEGWRLRDARNLRTNLEATFLIRLFAEFEAGLRDAWRGAFGRDTQPHVTDLILAIGRRRLVPQDWLDSVDIVRQYRNTLIHEEHVATEPVLLADARRRLCRFLSRLPPDW